LKLEKRHYVAGGLALLSLTAATLYWQYTKIMNYCIGFKRIKLNAFSLEKVDFDVTLNFKNNSDLTIHILSQDYKVFLNNEELVQVSNQKSQTINPVSDSEISVNIAFLPRKAGSIFKNIAVLVASPEKINIRVDIKLKVKLFFITVSVPYSFKTTLKDIMNQTNAPKEQKSSGKGKC
jgi:LEA14-like dessication related protein